MLENVLEDSDVTFKKLFREGLPKKVSFQHKMVSGSHAEKPGEGALRQRDPHAYACALGEQSQSVWVTESSPVWLGPGPLRSALPVMAKDLGSILKMT